LADQDREVGDEHRLIVIRLFTSPDGCAVKGLGRWAAPRQWRFGVGRFLVATQEIFLLI
jgi:hypothetical protein